MASSDSGPTADSSTQTESPPTKTSKEATFANLLPELKALIVDHVLLPTDLKNVCLVNKELHAIAVKPLYREVNLDLGSANDSRLSGFLSPNNIGLQHVRQLRLYLANIRDRCNQRNQVNFATRMILEFLPRDILEDFRCDSRSNWCPWESFPSENLSLLYRRQRKLNRLEVMNTDKAIMPALEKDPQLQKDVFSHATKLALYPENRQTLQTGGYYLKNMADKLTDLVVHTSFDSNSSSDNDSPTREGSLEPRVLNDSAGGPGLITNTIFGHLLPFDDCNPLPNLTYLRLNKINLRYCADSWCKVIDFVHIKSLRLSQCSGADALFAQLSKAHHLPKELKLLELQLKDNQDNEVLHALDGLLCLLSGIADLVIDIQDVKTLPAVAGIVRHGKTLKTLSIHATPDNALGLHGDDDGPELVYSSEDLEKICKAATGLQQLSCAWPATNLLRTRSEKWNAFENACLHLKSMVTLHITTWPTTKPSTQLLPKTVYLQLLQALATSMFNVSEMPHVSVLPTLTFDDDGLLVGSESWPPSKLRMIAFGVSEKQYDREEPERQFIYLRSTCFDAQGRPANYATPIGWCLREFVEPRSDVLELDLHLKPRPPCRDRDQSAWGDDDDIDIEPIPVFHPIAPPPPPGALHIHDI